MYGIAEHVIRKIMNILLIGIANNAIEILKINGNINVLSIELCR